MYTKTISKGTYFNSEVIRSTFVADDELTFAIHGDKIDGDDLTQLCVWEDIGVYLYINILHSYY